MYLKNGLAERREGGTEGRRGTTLSTTGKARPGRTHFQARAYLSQQPQQVHKGKKFGSFLRAF